MISIHPCLFFFTQFLAHQTWIFFYLYPIGPILSFIIYSYVYFILPFPQCFHRKSPVRRKNGPTNLQRDNVRD
ncbi:hypothetical protein BDZ91DRAFT_82626 [Kalaharituber pfeilii]|nr:hypothetical protein BDZ91DRAFT_82626 [Kalaharituber pfeilii]